MSLMPEDRLYTKRGVTVIGLGLALAAGVALSTHAEVLEWDAPEMPAEEIAGYEVFNKLEQVGAVEGNRTFIDIGTLAPGAYEFTARTVGTNGLRSDHSTPVPYVVAQLEVTPTPTRTAGPTPTPRASSTPTPWAGRPGSDYERTKIEIHETWEKKR